VTRSGQFFLEFFSEFFDTSSWPHRLGIRVLSSELTDLI